MTLNTATWYVASSVSLGDIKHVVSMVRCVNVLSPHSATHFRFSVTGHKQLTRADVNALERAMRDMAWDFTTNDPEAE